jgi:hypothetical protein
MLALLLLFADLTLIKNDKLELSVQNPGGAFTKLLLLADPAQTNPMWKGSGNYQGHFLCLDGFGPTSKEEQAAGLPGHGEAVRQSWTQSAPGVFSTRLPLLHEAITRRITLLPGEQVITVETTVTNELAFDRPLNWAEHGTIGAPFLTPGQTVVDASVGRCLTRPDEKGGPKATLRPGVEFSYPHVPLHAGGTRNIRSVPPGANSLDHTGCAIDPNRTHGFVTALHLDKRLVFGYYSPRADYPWLQEWHNYPASGELSRGLEFGTQPFDVSRREAISLGKLFDQPTYRWLPAKSKIAATFHMFYAAIPPGFDQVDDVRHENGYLVLTNNATRQTIRLAARNVR